MKLLCDICGGPLQMCENGKGATCTGCGMNYSVENLRARFQNQTTTEPAVKPIPDMPVANSEATKIQRH